MARPAKFTAALRAEYLDLIRGGGQRAESARRLSVDPRTVQKAMWKRTEEGLSEPTTYGREVMAAERETDEVVVGALFRAATVDRNVQAIREWLHNRRPDEWKDQRRQVITGQVGGTVTHELGTDARAVIFDRIEAMGANMVRTREILGPAGLLPAAVVNAEVPDCAGTEGIPMEG